MGTQVKVLIAEDDFWMGEMIQGVAEEAGCIVVGGAGETVRGKIAPSF